MSRNFKKFSTKVCPKTGFRADVDSASNARIINGREISQNIKSLLKREVKYLQSNYSPSTSFAPKLGYVLVGNKPDSELYVRMKKRVCRNIGIETVGKQFKESATQEEVESYVQKLNEDPSVSGILVQLPLPEKLNSNKI